MYLSKLSLYSGFPGKTLVADLRCFYDMHRTIRRAFPLPPEKPGRYLFRLDGDHVIVQSELMPNWSFFNSPRFDCYLDCPPQVREIGRTFATGQTFVFRITASPDRAVPREGRKPGRIGILDPEAACEWFRRQSINNGFNIIDLLLTKSPRKFRYHNAKKGMDITITLAQFDGVLEVADPVSFARAADLGIGAEKAFGAGLLSLRPVRTTCAL